MQPRLPSHPPWYRHSLRSRMCCCRCLTRHTLPPARCRGSRQPLLPARASHQCRIMGTAPKRPSSVIAHSPAPSTTTSLLVDDLVAAAHMGSDGAAATPAKVTPKKANLLDPHSIKHLLDETISDVVKSKGYTEDTRLGNWKLGIGAAVIAVALLAQFYPKKFPQNREFLLGCIALYVVLNVVLLILSYTKEKDAIIFTHPPAGSFNSTGLTISSKLPRFSDMYTLTIASADPQSISANKPVHITKSVTKWFTKEGVLVEGLFWKDVEKLIDDYNSERKSK